MQRFGRVVKLREGAEVEYDRYHAHVWPEVRQAVGTSGIRNYSIFRYGRWLFSYFELPDDLTLEKVGKSLLEDSEAGQRWEEIMHTLQEPLPESASDSWWVPMKEVYHSEN